MAPGGRDGTPVAALLRVALGLAIVAAGCGGPLAEGLDAGAGVIVVGAPDGAASADGATVAADGGPEAVDATAADAARVDAAVEAADAARADAARADAATDAGALCGPCPEPGPCEVSVCALGGCAVVAAEDGASCGDSADPGSVCVAGACVVRGCGDGYREPGPTPAREACDDGRAGTADACDDACQPQPFEVGAGGLRPSAPAGARASIGVDARGSALVVVDATSATGDGVLLAVRHDAAGNVQGAPLAIDDGHYAGWPVQAAVIGADDGWVVAWTSPSGDGDGAGVLARRVSRAGALGPVVAVTAQRFGDQREPALARLASGDLAVVWVDAGLAAATTAVRLRILSAELVAVTDELDVSGGEGRDEAPVVAADAEGLVVAWARAVTAPQARPLVLARRFTAGGGAVDEAALLVSDRAADGTPDDGDAPAVATLDDGGFLVAWSTHAADARGDVRGRRFTAAGDVMPSFALAAQPGFPESSAALAAAPGGGAVVLVHRGSAQTDVVRDVAALVVDADLELPPALVAALAGPGRQRLAQLVRAPGALWFLWSDDGAAAGAASTVSHAFLLPLDREHTP